jgi:endonuclease/exonuclease/phosphatase (EEP) superfamily protein YafD
VVLWPLAVATALLATVRLLGLDHGVLLVQLVSFTPYVVLGGLAVALLAALARRPYAAGVAGLAALTLAVLIAPRALSSPTPTQGTGLVVMSANTHFGDADPASIVDLVRGAGVDVLTLQEYTPRAEHRLLAAGLADVLPYWESHPAPGASGSAVYSRLPLGDGGLRLVSTGRFSQAYATVTMADGKQVIVESVHPVPPIDGEQLDDWSAGLRDQVRGDAPGPARILAGDFNATLDHRGMREVLATGYVDAADAVGAGLTPTWPYNGARSLVTPKVALDHILVPPSIGVRDFRAVTIPDTDHRAIIATLVVP